MQRGEQWKGETSDLGNFACKEVCTIIQGHVFVKVHT